MSTNPLKAAAKMSATMDAARAQKFARWALESGDGEKAAAWSKYARELAAAESGQSTDDAKTRAAGA
jgi:hypothetical protein